MQCVQTIQRGILSQTIVEQHIYKCNQSLMKQTQRDFDLELFMQNEKNINHFIMWKRIMV